MSMMSKAREAASLTPESRNRAADFYRVAAICFVVLLAFRYKKLLRKTRYKGVFMKSE